MAKGKIGIYFNEAFCIRFRELYDNMPTPLTYEQFGKEIGGVSRQAIAKYYNGHTYPNSANLIQICKYFNVSADYILGLTDYKTTQFEIADMGKQLGLEEPILNELLSAQISLNPQVYTYLLPNGMINTAKNTSIEISPLAKSINYLYRNNNDFIYDLFGYLERQKTFISFCNKYKEVSKVKTKTYLKWLASNDPEEFKKHIKISYERREEANNIYLNAIEVYNEYQNLLCDIMLLKDTLSEEFKDILNADMPEEIGRIGTFLLNLKRQREIDLKSTK